MTIEWLAGNRIRGTSTERTGATVAHATPTKIIDGNYTVLTYTADGKFIPKNSFNVEWLVVAGGGGGGDGVGAGGGAGGYRTGTGHGVTAQTYNITIGSGGAYNQQGNNSSITPTSGTTITSIGGGSGGGNGTQTGGNGGSGGGGYGGWSPTAGSGGSATTITPITNETTTIQGKSGGSGSGSSGSRANAGGGGGHSTVGADGNSSNSTSGRGGNGGNGTSNSITGSAVTYADGGGGATYFGNVVSTGGSGNGGSGCDTNTPPTNGVSGTGSGGGGGVVGAGTGSAGNGGSGVVILRFLTSGNDYDVEEIGLMPTLPSGSVGGWHEVGRTTLDSTGNNIDVSSLPDKRYYMFLTHAPTDSSGYVLDRYRLNADTGSNYSFNSGLNGGAFGTGSVSQSEGIVLSDGASIHQSGEIFTMGYISNVSGKEKLLIGNTLHNDTAGSGTAPDIAKGVGKHAQTSNPVTSVNVVNTNNSGFASGSEVVVLGWDHEDVHTTNFWEELASVDWSSGNEIDTGSFIGKKYLWVQISYQNSTANWSYLTFNNDTTGANYASRHSSNGATAVATAPYGNNESFYQLLGTGSGGTYTNNFTNMFIINNASNEKLVISNSVQIDSTDTGANHEPTTRREGVGKWTNTSDQITQIKLVKSSNNLSGGTIKVWGSD